MKRLLIASALVAMSMSACTTTMVPSVPVASAVYSDRQVTVTMGNGLSYTFTRGEICGRTRGQVGGHPFPITGSGGGSNVAIGGVPVDELTCPTVSTGGGDNSSNWVLDTNPEGTYSPEVSGSNGDDSTNVEYNPTGTQLGDQGINNQGGFAPPPNVTRDPQAAGTVAAAPAPAATPAPAAAPAPATTQAAPASGTDSFEPDRN